MEPSGTMGLNIRKSTLPQVADLLLYLFNLIDHFIQSRSEFNKLATCNLEFKTHKQQFCWLSELFFRNDQKIRLLLRTGSGLGLPLTVRNGYNSIDVFATDMRTCKEIWMDMYLNGLFAFLLRNTLLRKTSYISF